MVLALRSPAFEDGKEIPIEYTCQGDDISPPFEIYDIPEGTASLALVMDDPDAKGGFVHWVMFNFAPRENIQEDSVPEDATEGLNDSGNIGYAGPCPPSGTHTYRFRLYALDVMLELQEGASKEELESAMEGHIIEDASLTGKFSK